jgi:hypothetical protein
VVDVDQLEEGAQQQMVTFEWDPVPADWANALRAFSRQYRFGQWLAVPLAVFSIALLVINQAVAACLIGLAASAFAALAAPVHVRLLFARHPGARKTMTGEADETSVRMTVSDGTGRTELPWSTLSGWRATSRGFVLKASSDSGAGGADPAVYPVPNRAFGSPADRDRFRELLERLASSA